MPTSQLEDMLYAAISTDVDADHGVLIAQICGSAGAVTHKLGAESVEQLLQHTVNMSTWGAFSTLIQCLPEAQTLSPTAAGDLLLSALEAEEVDIVAALCYGFPPAACMDAATCRKAVVRAIELEQLDPAEMVLGLDAAEQLPATAIGELLAAAIKADAASLVHVLCELPGAEQLEHETLVELIIAAEGAWTDKGDFSRGNPDRTLWSLADLKGLAEDEWRHRDLELQSGEAEVEMDYEDDDSDDCSDYDSGDDDLDDLPYPSCQGYCCYR